LSAAASAAGSHGEEVPVAYNREFSGMQRWRSVQAGLSLLGRLVIIALVVVSCRCPYEGPKDDVVAVCEAMEWKIVGWLPPSVANGYRADWLSSRMEQRGFDVTLYGDITGLRLTVPKEQEAVAKRFLRRLPRSERSELFVGSR
jgi:hypothetical protein